MAVVYKTFTKTDLDNKAVVPTTPTIKQSINTILANFIQYVKIKHS